VASPTCAPAGTRRGEDAVVRRIAEVFQQAIGSPPPGEVWIGDDAAVVGASAGRLVLATDAVVAGVHADLTLTGLDDLGWKALTATLSDIGAVGGRPTYAVVDFCVPPGTDVVLLARGVAEAAAEWGCPVVGGDVTASSQVVVAAAATGVLEGDAPAVLRSGASPGDRLLVTGPLGASAAGLRLLRAGVHHPNGAIAAHRRPRARLEEGVVARRAGATAMMDVYDGLGIDLNRLADASGVGLSLETVPVAQDANEDEALGGGEDFELILATPDPGHLTEVFVAAGLRPPVEIGSCTADRAERTLRGRPFGRTGFEHTIG
jgi:thiamine-monophosphate kinase